VNLSQFTAYLQAYLQTNDQKVIDAIPTFTSLAAGRIAANMRGTLLERVFSAPALATFAPPADFLAMRSINVGGPSLLWASPSQLADLKFAQQNTGLPPPVTSGPIWFTIAAGSIEVWPAPATTATMTMVYLGLDQATPSSILAQFTTLLLHAASMEAQMFQGDNEAAVLEQQIFDSDFERGRGWELQGRLTLGGL